MLLKGASKILKRHEGVAHSVMLGSMIETVGRACRSLWSYAELAPPGSKTGQVQHNLFAYLMQLKPNTLEWQLRLSVPAVEGLALGNIPDRFR